MKRSWLGLVILLCSCSAAVYIVWFVLLGEIREIEVWFLGSLAFLPLQVLIVSLVLERVMAARERDDRLEKLNVVIGAFYSELGREMLVAFSGADPNISFLKKELLLKSGWSGDEYRKMAEKLKKHEFRIETGTAQLIEMKDCLVRRREFMLRMMENPNLLEHETFTDLLRAIFHVTEELEARKNFKELPANDLAHLRLDISRSYRLLTVEWLAYMHYMSREYPYLFHLALRQNPFDEEAEVIVR